jgi:hypothetical protein
MALRSILLSGVSPLGAAPLQKGVDEMNATITRAIDYLFELPENMPFAEAILDAPQFVRDGISGAVIEVILKQSSGSDCLLGTAHDVVALLRRIDLEALPARSESLRWRPTKSGVEATLDGWVLKVLIHEDGRKKMTLSDPEGNRVFTNVDVKAWNIEDILHLLPHLPLRSKRALRRIGDELLKEGFGAMVITTVHQRPKPEKTTRRTVHLAESTLSTLTEGAAGSLSAAVNKAVLQHAALVEEIRPSLPYEVWELACAALLSSSQPLWDFGDYPPHRAARLHIFRWNEQRELLGFNDPSPIEADRLEKTLYDLTDGEWIGVLGVVERVHAHLLELPTFVVTEDMSGAISGALAKCGVNIEALVDEDDEDGAALDSSVEMGNVLNWLQLDDIIHETPVSPQALADVTRMTIIHDETDDDREVRWRGICFPGSSQEAAIAFAEMFDSDITQVSWYEPKPLSE